MIISHTLNELTSFEAVIELLNSGGTSDFNADELAAQYAWTAQQEACHMEPNDCDMVNIIGFEFHLDFLVENGAEFDYREALKLINTAISSAAI